MSDRGGGDGVYSSGRCCWKRIRLPDRWPVKDVAVHAAAAAPRAILILPCQLVKRWPPWRSFLGGPVGLAVAVARGGPRGSFRDSFSKIGSRSLL